MAKVIDANIVNLLSDNYIVCSEYEKNQKVNNRNENVPISLEFTLQLSSIKLILASIFLFQFPLSIIFIIWKAVKKR